VAPQRGAAAAREQPEAILESSPDLLDAEDPQAGRRQLERQRDAVESGADLRDRRGVLRRDPEVGLRGRRPLDEQSDGLAPGQRLGRLGRRRVTGAGQRQRRHAEGRLAGDPQQFAAGGQHPHAGAATEEGVREAGGGLDQVLAVVQHEQQALGLERVGERLRQGPTGFLAHPQGRRHRLRRAGGLGEGGQLHQPHAVKVRGQHVRRRSEGQAGLAHPAGTGQRHQAVGAQQRRHRRQLPLAPDEAGQRQGQVVPRAVRRPPRRGRHGRRLGCGPHAGRRGTRRVECGAPRRRERQGRAQALQRAAPGPGRAPLEVLDAADGQSGPRGEGRLRQAGRQPRLPEEDAERGR